MTLHKLVLVLSDFLPVTSCQHKVKAICVCFEAKQTISHAEYTDESWGGDPLQHTASVFQRRRFLSLSHKVTMASKQISFRLLWLKSSTKSMIDKVGGSRFHWLELKGRHQFFWSSKIHEKSWSFYFLFHEMLEASVQEHRCSPGPQVIPALISLESFSARF